MFVARKRERIKVEKRREREKKRVTFNLHCVIIRKDVISK